MTLLICAVTSEYLYCKSISTEADRIFERFDDANTADDYFECAGVLRRFIESKRSTNKIFFSKDLTDKLICETDKLADIAKGDSTSDTKAQLENVRFLFKSIYRFNVDS